MMAFSARPLVADSLPGVAFEWRQNVEYDKHSTLDAVMICCERMSEWMRK